MSIRDNVTTGNPDIDNRKGHFEDIFQILQSAGELQCEVQTGVGW